MSKLEDDNECFKWAVISAIFPSKKDSQRLTGRIRENSKKFHWDGIEFPIDIMKGKDKFERQNPYKINVFENNKTPNTVRFGGDHGPNVINLLLI